LRLAQDGLSFGKVSAFECGGEGGGDAAAFFFFYDLEGFSLCD
jgi:hypothetical protein